MRGIKRFAPDYPLRFAAYMAAYYGTTAIYQSYIAKYYQSAGVENAALTVLLAVAPVASLAAQPFWGAMGDRSKRRVNVLRLCTLCAAVLALSFTWSSALWWLMLTACAYSFFFTSIQPVGDSLVLETLDKKDQPFGPLRLVGCLTFAVLNLLYGRVLLSGYDIVPYMTAGMLLVTLLSSRALPDTPGHNRKKHTAHLRDVFRAPEMKQLMTLVVLLQICMGYFYNYYSIRFTELEGGTSQLLGVAYFISAVSEVPFILYSDRLFKRFGTGRLMLCSAALLTVRFFVLASTSSVGAALASQLCHGGGFIVITVSMSRYISYVMPPELKTAGQTMLSVAGFALARTVGILAGGFLSGVMGVSNVFYVTGGICFITLVCFAPRYLRLPPLNGRAKAGARSIA